MSIVSPDRSAALRRAKRQPQDHGALDEIGQRASHDEKRKADAKRRQHRTAALHGERGGDRDRGNKRRGSQALRGAIEITALPSKQRPERHRQQQRQKQRRECRIEEWRANGNLGAGQRFERERIKRADQYGRAGGGQEQIVEDERAFA